MKKKDGVKKVGAGVCSVICAVTLVLAPLKNGAPVQASGGEEASYAYVQDLIDAGSLTAKDLIDMNALTGWADVEGDGLTTTTGGGDAVPVLATDFYELCMYAESDEPSVIIVAGELTPPRSGPAVEVGSNTTIVGIDEYATLNGGIEVKGKENVIISNLNIHGSWDNVGPDDAVSVRDGSHHVWLDHLNVWDADDGNMDLVMGVDNITVSWCKFSYTNAAHEHRLSNLIGSGTGHDDTDTGKLNVTYHHCWFAENCDQRMPRILYGKTHVYNNYYTCTGNTYCIGVGCYGEALVENNYFENVKSPHQFMYTYALPASIYASGNIYDNTTGSRDEGVAGVNSDAVSLFTEPPYAYLPDDAGDVPALVKAGAGTYTIVENPNGTPAPDVQTSDTPDETPVPTGSADGEVPRPVAVYEAGETVAESTVNEPEVVEITDQTALNGAKAWKLKSTDSALSVTNPLIGCSHLAEEVSVDRRNLPVWNEGVTITYWVKTTSGSRASALLTFQGENVETVQKDSLAKYRLTSAYAEALEKAEANQTTRPENDPGTEFYLKEVDAKGTVLGNAAAAEEYTKIYDVYAYALNKGIVTEDMTAAEIETAIYKGLLDQTAVPDLIAASPGFDRNGAFLLSYNDDGTPKLSVDQNHNHVTAYKAVGAVYSDINSGWGVDYTRYNTLEGVFQGTTSSDIEYGWATGMLQLHSDCTMFFAQDVTNATRYKWGSPTSASGLQAKNYVLFDASDDLTALSPEADEEWHYVAYVIKNNEMYCYIDGRTEANDVVYLPDITTYTAEKSFNLGTGLAYPFQRVDTYYDMATSYYSGNCNGMTIMEWLTAATTTTLNIGSATTDYARTYSGAVYRAVSGTQLARVKVYDTVLDAAQVTALYEEGDPKNGLDDGAHKTEEPETWYYGDVDLSGSVTAEDALKILQHVVRLSDLGTEERGGLVMALADADQDGYVTAADALRTLQVVVHLAEAEIRS